MRWHGVALSLLPWVIGTISGFFRYAAAPALPIHEFVGLEIRADGPKIIISDVEAHAVVVGPAPAADFHRRCAALLSVIAVRAAGNGIKFVKVEFRAFAMAVMLYLFPKPIGI